MTQLTHPDDCTTDAVEEVTSMTAATVSLSRRPRAHGFDRAVMRLSLAMMVWARKRSGSGLSEGEYTRIRNTARATERREHEWYLRAARLR